MTEESKSEQSSSLTEGHKSKHQASKSSRHHSSADKDKQSESNSDKPSKVVRPKHPESPSKFELSSAGSAIFDSPVKSSSSGQTQNDQKKSSKDKKVSQCANEVKISQSLAEIKVSTKSFALLESPIVDEAQLSKIWDSTPKIQSLTKSTKSGHTSSKQNGDKSSQSFTKSYDKSSQAGGHKRSSESLFEPDSKFL